MSVTQHSPGSVWGNSSGVCSKVYHNMEFCWVVAHNYVPSADPLRLTTMRDLGVVWGPWKSWRLCQTDNVIVNEFEDAQTLLTRKFNDVCNFWTNEDNFAKLGRPDKVNLYRQLINPDLILKDDILALALAASRYKIVLVVGYDLSTLASSAPQLDKHNKKKWIAEIKKIIKTNSNTQFVFVDLPKSAMQDFSNLENFTNDTYDNILKLLVNID